jgi:predicted metalloprotease
MPETDREARAALTANPLYAQSLAPTACAISAIDLVGATKAETAAHLNQFVSCLMAAWRPPVMTAGFELPHPSVTVYTGEINSPCGVLPTANAVYCTADQQIYYSSDLIESFPRSLTDVRFFSESVIAHEFGHTVQYRTEILIGEAVEENAAITEDDQQDLSRRLELQADCFAGLFLSAVAQSTALSPADEQNIVDVFASLGGTVPYSDDHGTGTNRAYWATQGLGSTNVGACSTFTAPDDQVS